MLEWLGEVSEGDRKRIIHDAFARVAATEDGMVLLMVLFEGLYFFRPTVDEEGRVLNNYAKKLMTYFGKTAEIEMLEAMFKSSRKPDVDTQGEKDGD